MKRVLVLIFALLIVVPLASAESLDAVYDYVTAQGFEVSSDAPNGFEGAPVPFCLCMETKMTVGDDIVIPMCYVIWGEGDQIHAAGGTDDESAAKARQLYVDVLGLYDWQVARYSNGADVSLGYNLSAYSDSGTPEGVTEYDTLTDYTAAVYEYILTNP